METIQPRVQSPLGKLAKRVDFGPFYSNFSTLHPSLEISGDLWQVKFLSPVRQFHEKANLLTVIPPKYGKI